MPSIDNQFLSEQDLVNKALQALTHDMGAVTFHRQWQEQLDGSRLFE